MPTDKLTSAKLAVAFLLELAMLAAFAYWGFHAGTTSATKIALGIGIPLSVAIIWGAFMAPRSARRLQGGAYLVVKTLLFGLAALCLVEAGQVMAGLLLAGLYLVSIRWNG